MERDGELERIGREGKGYDAGPEYQGRIGTSTNSRKVSRMSARKVSKRVRYGLFKMCQASRARKAYLNS